MILKDLETVGDKPLKKELDDHSPTINNQIEQAINESSGGANVAQSSSNSLQQLRLFLKIMIFGKSVDYWVKRKMMLHQISSIFPHF